VTDTTVNPGTDNTVNPGTGDVVVKTDVVDNTLVNKQETKTETWYKDDWRNQMAGNDAKELARLARFTDPTAVYKSYRDLETKVSSGALKQEVDISKLDETQLADWRKANGIPATPGEYELNFPEGLVLSDEDETILGSVLETMHKQGRKASEVNDVVNKFLGARELAVAARMESDKVAIVESEETLRKAWQGADYQNNIAAVKNLLVSAPNGLGEQIAQARLPNGKLLGTDPTALQWLATMAMELNPAGTIVPGQGTDQMKSIQSELAELNQLMAKDINAWRKNEPARERHRQLIDAELKLKARGY